MEIQELKQPTRAELSSITQILMDAFWPQPMFSDYLFVGHPALCKAFLAAVQQISVHAGHIFVAREEGNIIACALWSDPDEPEMNWRSYFRLGMGWRMLYIALRSPRSMRRISELFEMLERNAPETSYATLEFLASARKGAGAALLRTSMAAYPGVPLYLESIVSKNDHAYYRQFGFEPFARTNFHGTDYAFMLRQPSVDSPA